MEQATSANLFQDVAKLVEQFKLPGLDIAAVLDSRRKDVEALIAANKVLVDGAQTLGQKQAEILRKTFEELGSLVQQATTSGAPTETATKTAELAQQVLHQALGNMRELAETAYKSQTDTFAVVSARIEANVDELRALLTPKK